MKETPPREACRVRLTYHVIVMVILVVVTVLLYNHGLAAIPLILLSAQLFWLTYLGLRHLKKRT